MGDSPQATPTTSLARFPQPLTEDVTRALLGTTATTCSLFEAIEPLFGGRPELVTVLLGYRGRELLSKVLGLVEARGLRLALLEQAHAELEASVATQAKTLASSSRWLNALMFATVLRDSATELPAQLRAAYRVKRSGYSTGSLTDAEKQVLRDSASSLGADDRALVHAAFHLGA